MILLDTNVISEPWKPMPDPRMLAWLDAQAIETLYVSAVTVAASGLMVATRDTNPIKAGGLSTANPWEGR